MNGDPLQGSGECISQDLGADITESLMNHIAISEHLYEQAMEDGVCAEQARLFLPAYGMYVRYYWTTSLQSVCHFLNQRLASDSQKEIQLYAEAVYKLAIDKFPVSIEELVSQ